MAKAAALTNIQQEVWDFIRARGPVAKINWSKMLTKLDPKRQKGYTVNRIHKAADDMNQMKPCRMKMTHGQKDYGVGLEAL